MNYKKTIVGQVLVLILILFTFSLLVLSFIPVEAKDEDVKRGWNDKNYEEEFKGELFGDFDYMTIVPHEEILSRDIGNFVVFYKYGEEILSKSTHNYLKRVYYLMYDKFTDVIYYSNDDFSRITPMYNSDGSFMCYSDCELKNIISKQ